MRVFALGLLLAACSGGAAQRASEAQAGASASGGAPARAPSDAAGVAGMLEAAGASVVTQGGGASAGGASGQGGAAIGGAGAQAVAGAGAGGSGRSGAPGVSGGGGAPQQGGSAGSADPLEPFPAPGCEDWTAYRVPAGKFLAVTGDFQTTLLKNGVCQVLVGAPYYESCSAPGNVNQCICTVTSPPSCGQSCDGAYLVTVIRAEPGKTFHAELQDGDGHCVAGVPVAK